MIKLKTILSENIDEFDNWAEYIEYEKYAMPKEDVSNLIKKFNLQGKKYLNGSIIKLWDNKQSAWLEFDGKELNHIEDINQWLYDLNDNEYSDYVDPDIIYNNWAESSLKDLRTNPGKVYHWTTEEAFAEIQQSGKIIGSGGSGINNRSAYGIFTSVDPEEYQLGSYGNVCLELDLDRFMKESGKIELNLSWEPQVEEYMVREYLRSALEIENDHDELESDISPYTVIVNEVIPIKYVKQI